MATTERPPRRMLRILWFVGLWLAGVAGVGGASYGLKWIMENVVGL